MVIQCVDFATPRAHTYLISSSSFTESKPSYLDSQEGDSPVSALAGELPMQPPDSSVTEVCKRKKEGDIFFSRILVQKIHVGDLADIYPLHCEPQAEYLLLREVYLEGTIPATGGHLPACGLSLRCLGACSQWELMERTVLASR